MKKPTEEKRILQQKLRHFYNQYAIDRTGAMYLIDHAPIEQLRELVNILKLGGK